MANSLSDNTKNGVKGMGRNGSSVLTQRDIVRVIQARVDNIMRSIEEIAVKAANQTSLNAAIQSIETSLNRFSANVNSAPFKAMWIKFAIFRHEVKRLVNFTNSLHTITKNSEQGIRALTTISTLAEALGETMKIIRSIKTPKLMIVKTMRMSNTMKNLCYIAGYAVLISPLMSTAITAMGAMRVFTANLKVTMDMIRHTHAGFFLNHKLKRIMKALRVIQTIINRVARMKNIKKAFIKMSLIAGFFYMLALTMTVIVLLTPIFLLAPIAMIGILIALAMFWFMMWLMNKILAKSAKNAWIAMLLVMFITLCFVMIAFAIMLLIVLAVPILTNILWLIGLVVVIIIFAAVVALLGKTIAKKLDLILMAIEGMVLLLVVMTLMTVVVGLMYAISLMAQPIWENFEYIMGVMLVITSVGLAAVGIGAAATYAVVGIPGLAILIAILGLLTVITLQLKVLQEITLDIEDIKKILLDVDTATDLIKEYFASDEVSFGGLFNDIGSAAKLAAISNMVGTIEKIAKRLNEIQNIELDGVAIEAVVDQVYKVVDKIEEKINANDKLPDDFSAKELWVSFKAGIAEALQGQAEKNKLGRADAILGKLHKLSKTINEIQNVKIETETVLANIDDIYAVVDKIEEKINANDKLPDDFSAKDLWVSFKSGIAEALQGQAEKNKLSRADAILGKLHNISESINAIQELNINKEKVDEKITLLYSFVDDIQKRIQENEKLPEDFTISQWWSAKKKGWAEDMQAEAAEGKIGRSEAIIVKLSSICEALKTINEFEIDTASAKTKVTSLLTASNEIYDLVMKGSQLPPDAAALMNGQEWGKKEKKAYDALKEKRAALSEMTDDQFGKVDVVFNRVTDLCEKVKKIAELEVKQTESVNKANSVFAAVNALINVVETTQYGKLQPSEFNKKHIKMLNAILDINRAMSKLTQVSTSQVANHKNMLENYGKFIEKVNRMDITKVQKTALMFRQMSRFSESINGNFDRLAMAINEKLMPAVDALKEVLEEIPIRLDRSAQNITKAIDDTQRVTPPTQEELTEKYKNLGFSDDDVAKKVQADQKEAAKKVEKDIPKAIHHIKELLEGSVTGIKGLKIRTTP